MISTAKIKTSVFIATSLDGFIAKSDGSVDWLHEGEPPPEGEDFGFKAFFDSVDAMIIGRKAMEMVMSFEQWPYEGKRVFVLSNTLKQVPEKLVEKIELYSGPLKELITKLEDENCKRLYVDGGKTIQSFINESLITDMTITRLPVLLGEGIPLFAKTPNQINLQHVSTLAYSNGFVTSTYETKG